jgi:hypothetical protein
LRATSNAGAEQDVSPGNLAASVIFLTVASQRDSGTCAPPGTPVAQVRRPDSRGAVGVDKADAELLKMMIEEAKGFCARRWTEEKQAGRDVHAKEVARIVAKLEEVLALLG